MHTGGLDTAIADLAERQHGRVARDQLFELGLGRGAIELRLRRGRLHLVHRGVYAVGHTAPSREARWMAAVLAAGPGAALSHRAAAALWGIRHKSPGVDVTGPRRKRLNGVTVHRALLSEDEVCEEEGIPVTCPCRTLLDLAPSLPSPSLARVIKQAEMLELHQGPSLPELLERYPGRAGTPKLKAILKKPFPFTRSDLEARFLELVDRAGLPRPETNALLEFGDRRIEADCVWREQRLIVELDVYATHGSSFSFETDRARDRLAQVAGWTVVRITGGQLEAEPDAIVADLRRLLAASAARPPSRRAAA